MLKFDCLFKVKLCFINLRHFKIIFYKVKTFRIKVEKKSCCLELVAFSLHLFLCKKHNYHKIPKNSNTRKKCCNYPKIGTASFNYIVMGPKDADGIANSVDHDQTAPLGV